jgi:hypothetical protein
MTEETLSTPRRRRSPGKPCIREGCNRRARNGEWDTCCHLCRFLMEELDRAQRVCQTLGQDGADYWSSAVALSDALTEYYRSELRIYQAARSVGITEQQWHAIKRGTDTDG